MKINFTLAFRRLTSLAVNVSALAIIGIILTFDWRAFMHSMSNGLSLINYINKSKLIIVEL